MKFLWPRRLARTRTQAFQACNTGSNPVGVIWGIVICLGPQVLTLYVVHCMSLRLCFGHRRGRVYSVVFAGNTVTIVPAYGCIHVRVPQVVGCINEADVDIARGTLRSTPPGQSSITSITVVA